MVFNYQRFIIESIRSYLAVKYLTSRPSFHACQFHIYKEAILFCIGVDQTKKVPAGSEDCI